MHVYLCDDGNVFMIKQVGKLEKVISSLMSNKQLPLKYSSFIERSTYVVGDREASFYEFNFIYC